MYVPAVPDTKHEGFKFRLCSDELTRRSVLKQWHPKYQKWLDDAGIKATVYSVKLLVKRNFCEIFERN